MRSVQTVDACLAELLAVADEVNARFLVTSDHGNADDMVQRDKKGKPLVGLSLFSMGLSLFFQWVLVCRDTQPSARASPITT